MNRSTVDVGFSAFVCGCRRGFLGEGFRDGS